VWRGFELVRSVARLSVAETAAILLEAGILVREPHALTGTQLSVTGISMLEKWTKQSPGTSGAAITPQP